MGRGKLDTRAIGLDVGLAGIRWLTGAENLHYGLWDGLDPCAANLRAAQEAYTERLFALLPARPGLRILDIGGGAGETARKLIARGHSVDIVVPSAFLAARCRANAPQARVHECRFEDFDGAAGGFDICLFSESFQYIPPDIALQRAREFLSPEGEIVIGDCFRSDAFRRAGTRATVGGGHRLSKVRALIDAMPLAVVSEEDVTDSVAASVDVEQGLFNVVGHAAGRIDGELAAKRPFLRWFVHRGLALALRGRRRARLHQRLMEQSRNAEAFRTNNRYLMMRLRPEG